MAPKKDLPFFEEIKTDFREKTVFLDVDGTLLPDGEKDIEQKTIEQIKKLKQNNRVLFCTNCSDIERTGYLAGRVGLEIANCHHKKPSKRVLDGLSLPHNNFVVIGDKFLTDGLFAKNIGAEFIMVKKKISGRESNKIKIIYFMDALIYELYRLLKMERTDII